MQTLRLSKVFLKEMVRQRSVIFSSFILPIVIIWSTWWVTADIPMAFNLDSGYFITANMIDVHVVTGGLTAMGITSGLFGFIITAKNKTIADRLHQVGYSKITINISSFLALIFILLFTSILATILSVYFADPVNLSGFVFAILLITLIYASIGTLVAVISSNFTAGSLFILIFSFMDLMLFTNPMGEGIYLQGWTYFIPGFWPVQISLEAGFVGYPNDLITMLGYGLIYFSVILVSILILSIQKVRIVLKKIGGIAV